MTDPELADRTFIEPLTAEYVEAIIVRETPDALLPTVGGQTASNLAVELSENGVLDKYGVELIGAQIKAIKVAEDRLLFKEAMREIGLETPKSGVAYNFNEALEIVEEVGYPAIIRPSFTLGGTGGASPFNAEEFEELAQRGLDLSPTHEILIEESVIGWKEFELEVMRDLKDNVVIICSIENFDPMGVHTGDSVTVAPVQTLDRQRISASCGTQPSRSFARWASKRVDPISSSPSIRTMGACRDRNESSGFPQFRTGFQGNRLSHRENRGQIGRWDTR